ncbi:MBL fold metallo-hydrolase [Ideonella livida]|uniref:MBL fold metallo-hydrolase n=1 Tax=Ideonella livida TaxID=2707176 RepID=A0A7C9TK19_9BURK|nr:MBL fold metallo-hydrolase [Ideonella livida]NDY92420.1 MBL fold metallo-hydrolase [Ideonella livida]
MTTPTHAPLPEHTRHLGDGLYLVDTGFHRPAFDAAYLIVDSGRAAFIDTGTRFSVPRLLEALAATGLGVDAVDWVIPTHVHLDHAGGVGTLMQHLPQAQVLVHARGARHMVDPSALYQGALAVYGAEEMARSYGTLDAVPAERVQSSHDGQVIRVGQRELTLIDAPGHAKHHHAIWDARSRTWFTGDTFGISYRELDVDGQPWIFPTTTPVQFEPEALARSIGRMLAADPLWVCPTHYGRLGNVAALGARQLKLLAAVVELGERLRAAPDRHQALRDGLRQLYLADLADMGRVMEPAEFDRWMALDLELNAQGMGAWLDRPAR